MIRDNERLIVVTGMAHSGTTIFTYILKQHKNVVCCTNGDEANLLENDWLLSEDVDSIQALLDKYSNKMVLLKRPWIIDQHSDFLIRELPDAKLIYCYRNFKDISESWSKPGSFIGSALRDNVEVQKDTYKMCSRLAEEFSKRAKFFKAINHIDFLRKPKEIIEEMAFWIGLNQFAFDLSLVSSSKNIKFML